MARINWTPREGLSMEQEQEQDTWSALLERLHDAIGHITESQLETLVETAERMQGEVTA